mgnify:FL=1
MQEIEFMNAFRLIQKCYLCAGFNENGCSNRFNMERKYLTALGFSVTVACLCGGTGASAETANCSRFNAGAVPDIHPTGWLQTLMQRQKDGLTAPPGV